MSTLLSKVLAAVAAVAVAVVGALTALHPATVPAVEVWPPQPICSPRPSVLPSEDPPPPSTSLPVPQPTGPRPRPTATPSPTGTCDPNIQPT